MNEVKGVQAGQLNLNIPLIRSQVRQQFFRNFFRMRSRVQQIRLFKKMKTQTLWVAGANWNLRHIDKIHFLNFWAVFACLVLKF